MRRGQCRRPEVGRFAPGTAAVSAARRLGGRRSTVTLKLMNGYPRGRDGRGPRGYNAARNSVRKRSTSAAVL